MLPIIILIYGLINSPAMANDGFGALGVGGIIVGKTDDIALKEEILEIGYKNISVRYEFMNESSKDIESEVVFPLPAYPASPSETGVVAAGQPGDFSINVNGQSVKHKTQVRVLLGNADITAEMHALGFSDTQLATFPFEKTMRDSHQLPAYVSSQALTALIQKGYIVDNIPKWNIYVVYTWRQNFPAKRITRISHSYAPFISVGTTGGFSGVDSKKFKVDDESNRDRGREFVKTYCPTEAQVDRLNATYFNKKSRNLDAYGNLRGTNVDYILTTANTWKDGVRDFTLKIITGAPDEVVCTCFPAPLQQDSSGTYIAHLKNFAPKSDLSIYFGNIKDPGQSKSSNGIPPEVN